MALAIDHYFKHLERIEGAMSLHQYQDVIRLSYESLRWVPKMIEQWRREYGSFDITSIPCIELAARFSSAQGDVARLEQLRAWAAAYPELGPWLQQIDERIAAARVQPKILDLAASQPGFLQSDVPKTVGVPGRLTGRLIVDMEHLGYLKRVPSGKSYGLYLADS
ncbi:MAG: hypothetical protein QMD96_07745 [Anaerosomatales bacterium]|nr:hypothetical protein [Anaerosomatales bacterium]